MKSNNQLIRMTENLNEHFIKEAIIMANKYVKRWFSIISHEENANQNHRYQRTPARTATTRKTDNTKSSRMQGTEALSVGM